MNIPTLFRISESEEYKGILAPYLLTSEIVSLYSKFRTLNKGYIDYVNSIPDVTSYIHGNMVSYHHKRPYESVISTPYNGNSNPVGDPIISDKTFSESVLPPHKVYYGNEGTDPRYESNIYQPCLRDPEDKNKVFNTGGYPNNVSSGSIDDTASGNAAWVTESLSIKKKEKEMLNKFIDSTHQDIVDIQISNLIMTLIQTNRIPIKLEVIYSLKVLLKAIYENQINEKVRAKAIHRFGIYSFKSKSVKYVNEENLDSYRLMAYICVEDESDASIMNERIMKMMDLVPCQVSIAIVTPEQFATIQNTCPIHLNFECNTLNMQDMTIIELTYTDIDRFKPDVPINITCPASIEPQFPGKLITVPCGSSGQLKFMSSMVSSSPEIVYGLVLNKTCFISLTNLLNKEVPIREYGLLGLTATVQTTDFHSIFTLNYTGVTRPLDIELKTIPVLDQMEFDAELLEIKYSLMKYNATNLTPALDNQVSSLNLENEDEPSEVVDNTESENEEIEQKTNSTLVVKVPFTDVFKIWQSDLIDIKKVIRGFGEDGECKLISFEKIDDVVIREGDLVDGVNMKELELHIPVDSNTECVVEFNTGSLLTYKKVLSESLLATNSGNIELHFAINVETGKFDLYDGVELLADCPEWWLPKSDSENIEEEPQPGSPDTEPEPNEDGTTV